MTPPSGVEGHQAADGEADDGGPDDDLAAVLAHLAAPVGELGDPAAQRLDRVRELLALALDVGADLGRGAPGRRRGAAARRLAGAAADGARRSRPRAPSAAAWSRAAASARIRLPSSIARSGVGGEPAWTAL